MFSAVRIQKKKNDKKKSGRPHLVVVVVMVVVAVIVLIVVVVAAAANIIQNGAGRKEPRNLARIELILEHARGNIEHEQTSQQRARRS